MKNFKNKFDLSVTAYDEMFMTDAQRTENRLPKIYDLPIAEIDNFPEHPFYVKDDDEMKNLVESIRDVGVLTPILVREKEDGRYELVSGHRRKHACELLGMEPSLLTSQT
ncbi:MAG: ParB N-terminal domain-containing protein [Lachnospiraceae bacterium]|nr:ParB N-terminal domain-containing protein [Lachnospiraceae bacterium]